MVGDRLFLSFFLGNVVLIAATTMLLYLAVPPTPDIIPLHYTILFGIDRTGPWIELFLAPATGSAIFLVNLILSIVLFSRTRYLSLLALIGSLASQVMILLGAFSTIAINR